MLLRSVKAIPHRIMAAQVANVHSVAAAGFGEGTNDLYDRARPSYPAAALQYIHTQMGNKAGQTVVEPGSGTGIFSRLLLQPPNAEYPSFDLKELVAVEPSAGMRAAFERGMSKLSPEAVKNVNVRTVDGGFDDLSKAGVEKGTVDAMIIAQAFHWCPDHEKALTELASYLRPGAPLFLIWNLESNKDEMHAKLRELYQPLDMGSPQYYRGLWKAMFKTKAYAELFKPFEEAHFGWTMGVNEQQVVDRAFSKSYMTEAHLNGEKRVQVDKELRKIVHEGDKDWIDKEKGIFKYHYNTDVFMMRRA